MSAKKRVKVRKRAPRRAPAVTSGRPLLSLAMMVKDEEDFLADALRSARGWCDELVVVDTGSTDRTVEIARDLGAQVSFFPWCDSFSKARNETLKRATGRYVAILDADERFVGRHPEAIRPHLRPGPQHPYEALSVQVTNTRLDGSPISSFFSVRFFANDGHLGYSGRVHNRFGALKPGAPKVSVTKYLGLEVVHLG
ncbi:MAG: glycosyltransferase, partial [Myxococcales bacterium]|nr:glycosyltransferase [Myxococcales bacterium]